MKPSLIPSLLEALRNVPASDTVQNPYHGAAQAANLHAYLDALCSHPYSGHLFVGMAPGNSGVVHTGIPFSNQRLLRSGSHRFLTELLPSLRLEGDANTAVSVIWKAFSGKRSLPAFWYAFPFRPHSPGMVDEVRILTDAEIAEGVPFLRLAVQILAPHTIVAIGKDVERLTRSEFPHLKHRTFSHPSQGSAFRFFADCKSLGIP